MMVVNNSAREWLRLSNTEDETILTADSKSTLLKLNELGHRVPGGRHGGRDPSEDGAS